MKTNQRIGVALSGIGFALALFASWWLASRGGALIDVLGGALIAFVPVALFFGAGFYLYFRPEHEVQDATTSMNKQRDLVDILRRDGQSNFGELAQELEVSQEAVVSMVQQLGELGVFSGYVDWQQNIVYASHPQALRTLQNCRVCGQPIQLVGEGMVPCPHCQTDYFLV